MKKLIPTLALCFCMLPLITSAQEQANTFGNTEHLEMMHNASIDTLDQSGRFLGQTFTLETTSFVESIRFAAFDWRSLYDHTGTITFYADEAFGEVLFTSEVLFPGLSRFVEDPTLLEGLSANSLVPYWNSLLVNPLFEGQKTFEDIATTFPVNQMFDPGIIVAVIELDNYNSIDRPPAFTTFTNCVGFWCENQIDPYTGGEMVTDEVYNFFLNSSASTPMMDLAFEVRLQREISTSIGEQSDHSGLTLAMQNGVLVVPDTWTGGSLLVTDVLGRELTSFSSLVGGQIINVPTDQALVVTLIRKDGVRKTAKVFVGY